MDKKIKVFSNAVSTPDGGILMVGNTETLGSGQSDVFVLKLSSNLDIQWLKTIGGNLNDYGSAVSITSDGGYVISGSTESFGQGLFDVYVAKLCSSGVLEWTRTVGGGDRDIGTSVVALSDGIVVGGLLKNVVGGGWQWDDMYLFKLSNNGNTLLWSRAMYTNFHEYLQRFVYLSTENRFFSIGIRGENAYTVEGNMWSYKHNSDGTVHTVIEYLRSGHESPADMIITNDGGFLVVGSCTDAGVSPPFDGFALKLSSNGTVQWATKIGGIQNERFTSVIQTGDGGYLIGGYTTSFGGGDEDMYVVKLNDNGTLAWTKTYGTTSSDRCVKILPFAGGFLLVGNTYQAGNWDIFLVQITPNGQSCCATGQGGSATSITFLQNTPTYGSESGGALGSGGTTTSPVVSTTNICP